MTVTDDASAIEAQFEAFAEQVLGAALGCVELNLLYLGRTLGLYAAVRETDGLTAAQLGATAGVDERYAREWLEHQAVAGVLTVDDPSRPADGRSYRLPEAHAIALLDEEHPAYVGAMADIPPILGRTLEQVADAFRTGAGVPFAAYGLHDMQAGFTRPMFANSLVGEWVPLLPDVHARLQAGEALRIADVGCGEGWAAIYLAEAYPRVVVDGFDLDDVSVASARRHAADRGVADRVHFEVRDVTDPTLEGRYDVAYACEVIHDLPDPVGALRAMRRLTGPDGAVLVIDENATEAFEPSGDPIQRLLYAFSVLHCLPAGRAADESAATGTVMRPDTFRRYATEAGFERVDVLPLEHPMFRFYRPRG
jgi:2-polyprenyl-3-methyl-5-hydroxy-6-metoxy-1,4-benzoquinol methylase